MAYDEELAERIRECLDPAPDFVEKKMFGGLAFLVGGNMAVAVTGEDGLMVRVDRAEFDALLDAPIATPMMMGAREMTGWILVTPAALDDDAVLREWVGRGVAYARTLPRKR
ncbi:TfoX/Sxy family protein [Nocardia mangyaensis]|uniref:TfoX/Sxy family protein n=1 Tax=Nocardia mangyaensis TaxID=2213200 RepID=UPI00267480B3|nr:TfoX/Sxy family protein [Nocardia mangyaensis]MDO3645565.1 TfoX/Sxy family protein [Nocardia mangyaensis]